MKTLGRFVRNVVLGFACVYAVLALVVVVLASQDVSPPKFLSNVEKPSAREPLKWQVALFEGGSGFSDVKVNVIQTPNVCIYIIQDSHWGGLETRTSSITTPVGKGC